jgi:hypothetical protein
MKKILKLSTLALLLIAGVSCENDDQKMASPSGGPELLTPLDGSSYVLDPAAGTNEVTTLVWNHADYSVQTEVNYDVEVALAGTDFATTVAGGSTTNRFVVWSHEALNTVALEAGLTPYTAGDLEVRIKSSLGSNAEMVAYSNIITITITPYTTDLPKIAVPGNHQGWSPPTAPLMASSGFGQTNFEGYISLDGEFKFLRPKADGTFDWDGDSADWGDDGTFSGVLLNTGETNCTATAGYYWVKANTATLTYSITPITTWGIIGSATPGGWDSSTPMTYNPTTKKWSIVVTLVDGEYKFRSNNIWNAGSVQYNLGGFQADKVGDDYAGESMSYGGANLVVTAGTYLVELDLSNPRAYTYTLTPQ